MKRLLFVFAFAFLLTTAQAQSTLYTLGWQSPLPVQIARIETTAALMQVLTNSDGMSGTIAATAPRECLTIAADGQTTAGVLVRFSRSWSEECDRLYLPAVLR